MIIPPKGRLESETARQILKQMLREVEVNAVLASCVPVEIPRVGSEMALDWHDEPFYSKKPELRLYAYRGQAKEGTTYFYRLASLYVI